MTEKTNETAKTPGCRVVAIMDTGRFRFVVFDRSEAKAVAAIWHEFKSHLRRCGVENQFRSAEDMQAYFGVDCFALVEGVAEVR